MLLIHCPYCDADLPELEFRGAGEAHLVRPADMAEMSDDALRDLLFIRDNPKGLAYERWRHVHGCGRFFNAVRDTVSDRFVRTYRAGDARPEPHEFASETGAERGITMPRDHKMGGQPR